MRDADDSDELAEMDEVQQKIVNETLTDDVLLDIEEHNSTSNHLSQRGTRFYAGVLGASDTFLLASVLVSVMWAVDNSALLLFFVVGCAGVPMGLAIAACKSVIAADGCNAEKVYEEKKMQMLARLPMQNSLLAKAAERQESGIQSKLGALYIAYASTKNDFVQSAPYVYACGYCLGSVAALAAYWRVATSHLVKWPLLLPVIAILTSLGAQGVYEGSYTVLIAAVSIAIVKSIMLCVTYMLGIDI